ncbi:MAG TPA: hypothetical protein GXX75_05930 [Clostridiales bacterium]|nr:hypothetical protein [Clostridiales bacterium]
MNHTASIMKKEIRAIASYRALIISKAFISILLGIVTLYLAYFRYPASPLYILLLLNALPPILKFAFQDYAKRYPNKLLLGITQDTDFTLNYLKGKYKYSKPGSVSNSVSYIIALFLMCLWQLQYSRSGNTGPYMTLVPVTIMAAGLGLRFLSALLYNFKLHYDISHNKM